MAYATQNKENTSQQNNQQKTSAITPAFSDNRESTASAFQLQEMMARNGPQQKLNATTQLIAHSAVQQCLNSTAQRLANNQRTLQRFTDEELETVTAQRVNNKEPAPVQLTVKPNSTDFSNQSPIQLATAINHDSTTFNAEGNGRGNFFVATGMQAVLDPSDPVAGSAASGNATPNLNAICELFPRRLQQTHLLNADLGGFGVYENLYPMTEKANRDHFNNIEMPIKNSLVKANQNLRGMQTPQGEGNGIYYEINVAGTHSFSGLAGGTQFICEAYFIDDVINNPRANIRKPIVRNVITSNPNTDGAAGAWAGYGQVLNEWDHKQGNPNPYANENQQPYISKREGKADLTMGFSKYTKGQTWDDYKGKEKIFVNRNYSENSQVKPSELHAYKLLDQTMVCLGTYNIADTLEHRQQAGAFLQQHNGNPQAAADAMFKQVLLNNTMNVLLNMYSIPDTVLNRHQAGIFLHQHNDIPEIAAHEMWKHLRGQQLVKMCNEMVQEKGIEMSDKIGTKIAGVCYKYNKESVNPYPIVSEVIEKYLIGLLAEQQIKIKYNADHIPGDQLQAFLEKSYDYYSQSYSGEQLLKYLAISAETQFNLQFK